MSLLKKNKQSENIIQNELPIPYSISEYIKEHFDDDFLTEIKTEKDKSGQIFYKVDISNNDTYYHLKFNSEGVLIQKEMEPIFELGDDEYGITD